MMKTIFTATRNAEGYLRALILTPENSAPLERSDGGFEDLNDLKTRMQARYGEDAQFVSPHQFQEAVEQRQVHSPAMLALLVQYGELLGLEMASYLVYGSACRPMSAAWARIPDAVFMPSERYQTGYHTYIAVPTYLDEETMKSYELTFVSCSAGSRKS